MPVDLPNPNFFKPHRPLSIDKHFLFGIKFFKVHQFRDSKWPPTFLTHQYSQMVKCLKKNMQFHKLKIISESHKQLDCVQDIRTECENGRTRLKNAYIGDLTAIRRILMKRKDLQRKYKRMPLIDIMENCDQETFLKRKENDRLKYQLKIASERLKNVMLEQSKLEDRINYANEFTLQTDSDAKVYRKDIKNSQTRIEAYKLITRAYQRILSLLERDDIYFESVLDALENDICEQQNFIHQVISLGLPAKNKYCQLSTDYQIMEKLARSELKENSLFIAKVRRKLINLQRQTKAVVREYVPTKTRIYVRTTPSIGILQSNIEELETEINEIRLVTMSPDAETIEHTLEHLLNSLHYFEQKNKLDDKYKEVLTGKYDQAMGQKSLLTHNFSQAQTERSQNIDDLKLQVTYQLKIRDQCDDDIVNSGNMLQILNFALWNIADVLRHIGKKPDVIHKDYPNIDLKLPLLKFDFLSIRSLPPIEYDRSSKQLLAVARNKIGILVKSQLYKSNISDEEINANRKLYHNDYMKTLEDEESLVGRLSGKGSGDAIFATVFNDGNILSRANIKEMSAKIVEKNAKKDTD